MICDATLVTVATRPTGSRDPLRAYRETIEVETTCRCQFLVERCCDGDRSAREQLAKRALTVAAQVTYSMIDREDADDAAQDAASIAMLKLTDLRNPRRFDEWVRSIAQRQAWLLTRRRRRRTSVELPYDEATKPIGLPGVGRLGWAFDDSVVPMADVLEKLTIHQRRALVLRYVFGYSEGDVGLILGCRSGAASALIHRGRVAFRRARTVG